MKIFIIAGEDSGDKLGSAIMEGLRVTLDSPFTFLGIGGAEMERRGLTSIFPMSELSVMGFLEIASQYKNLKKRLVGQNFYFFKYTLVTKNPKNCKIAHTDPIFRNLKL